MPRTSFLRNWWKPMARITVRCGRRMDGRSPFRRRTERSSTSIRMPASRWCRRMAGRCACSRPPSMRIRGWTTGDRMASTLAHCKRRVHELQLEVEEGFGARQAEFCGALLGTRRDLGLSLGDCVCLTTAAWLGAVAVTADRQWKQLDGTVVNDETIRVELIR